MAKKSNNNNTQKFSSQFQYTGDGPLDTKQVPVPTVADLPSPLKAYEGQTITVLSDDKGETWDYQFQDGRWIKKYQVVDCGEFF